MATTATNFDVRISKDVAMELIKPMCLLDGNTSLAQAMGISVMCKEYGQDDEWVGVECDDYDMMKDDDEYQTFEIWYNTKERPVDNGSELPAPLFYNCDFEDDLRVHKYDEGAYKYSLETVVLPKRSVYKMTITNSGDNDIEGVYEYRRIEHAESDIQNANVIATVIIEEA